MVLQLSPRLPGQPFFPLTVGLSLPGLNLLPDRAWAATMPFAAESRIRLLARVFSFTALKKSMLAWQLGAEPVLLTPSFPL